MSLQRAFGDLFMASRGPKDAAMFTGDDIAADEYSYYFSPGAVRFAKAVITSYGGIPCPTPGRENMILLVGDAGARDALLPAKGSS